jgi:hypothetical protein
MARYKKLLWLLLMGSTALSVKALTPENPYARITERNVFYLHGPVAVETPLPKPPVLPKITLTGITTILGRPIAYLTITGVKAGEPPQLVMMSEGQGANDIQVTGIDKQAGIVKVINGVEAQILEFEQPKSSGMEPVKIEASPVAPPVQARNETPISPEVQAALIEVQRVKLQQENDPASELLPPLN